METKIATQTRKPRGSRKVTLWDTRTLSETVVFYGYATPEKQPRETEKGVIPLSMYLRLREKKPKISIHEINETQKGLNTLFKTHKLPEINTVKLYPEHPETFTLKIGDCVKQRSQYPYRIRAKNKIRHIKKRESHPLTLDKLKFNPKYVYTVSFKCTLCKNHQTMRIKDHKAKRVTPICKKHKQPMYIKKVTKKRHPHTRKLSIPKIIYQVNH